MIVPEETKPELAVKPEKQAKTLAHEAKKEETPDPRIAALESSLNVEKAKAEDYLKRLQYLQADFENYRKRVEKEVGDSRRFGNERLLSELLLVHDELTLALQKAEETEQNPVIVEGVGMVQKRLEGLLSKEGVKKIASVGSRFTPDLHEAALGVESDKEEGTVVEEIRAGYLLNGKVLRPSIVKVAEKHATGESQVHEGESE